ncbi:MAG: glycosyltransferase family 2 protein [Candidatus Omnitrophica bacterium]|nr:glycosyltransferase family 2 protein [Candidatus Omnitrophota bacterium]MBU4345833.1 glycosyltransferase family 2 protein [Candidatus Omnitrophota bacterium]MBU4473304.1 glycosyltransferase family 2 protein [Candidatus Omnitrophota bacterium]MCG2706599.1 glycosyltransferase family 2 protein [Candidatus Omnitrophota bacterium]
MKICVIIPTYNEAKVIGGLIRQIRQQDLEVLVVDDGSVDNTPEIARENGATVLRNQTNEGKGASLIKGFGYARQKDYEAVITMDGDGQHLPQDLPYFMRLAQDSDSAIFIGDRMSKAKNMPSLRFLTNQFMSWLISGVAKQKISDTQCGLRLIKRQVLEKLKLSTSKYETESEILIKASRLGFKIESVPIKSIYLGEKSQINPFVDTLRFIRFIVRELWITRY